jgi:hypothetical protein
MCGVFSSDSGYGPVTCACEHSDEYGGSIKGGEFD